MSRFFHFSILILLFLIIISKNCLATDGSILQAENSFSIGTGLLHIQYGETISGYSGYLDNETGDINTTIIEGTGLADDNADGNRRTFLGMRIFPGAYLSGKFIYADGSTDYDGHTLTGIPISTTDLATIVKANISFGKSYKLSDRVILIPTVNAGIHNWKRVANPNALFGGVNYESVEIYRHLSVGIGMKSDIRIMESEILTLGVDVLRNFNSNMTSSYTGNYYELGNSVTIVATGKITIEAAKNVNLFGALDFETFTYGKSDVAPNGFLEPDSKTSLTLYSVGFAYAY
jgi:hypothetical protein